MRKSTIFISAVLTTFALVMLYRVASAYNDNRNAIKVAAAPVSVSVPAAADQSAAAAPADSAPADSAPVTTALGPVDAANLAAKVVGNTSLLSAESSTFNGVPAYMITFTNNDVVYVGMDGQILSVQAAPVAPVVINNVVPSTQQKNNRGSGSHSSSGYHESSDDHQEHDD